MRRTYPSDPRWPCLRWDSDRRGNLRCYYRNLAKPGSKQERLRAPFGSAAFAAEYEAADRAGAVPPKRGDARPGDSTSLNYMLDCYYRSSAWTDDLSEATRSLRRPILDKMCARLDKAGRRLGVQGYATLSRGRIKVLRDYLKATPTMANEFVKALSRAFDYAIEHDMPGLKDALNPCLGIKPLARENTDGHHQWTLDNVHHYMDSYPLAKFRREHTAMAVLLYTGARRSDAVLFNDDMVLDGIEGGKVLHYVPIKGRKRRKAKGKPPTMVQIPILPPLQAVLDARPPGQKHWLVSYFGKPWARRSSLTDNMRAWCREIGLNDEGADERCTPHGLRKAAAAFAVENGASTRDLMAIFGWETERMAAFYSEGFERAQVASRSMHTMRLPIRGAQPIKKRG
jgi:integrase